MNQRPTLQLVLSHYRGILRRAENLEMYEICVAVRDQINAIENFDIKKYMKLNFDCAGLTKEGFFRKGDTYMQQAERITTYFGLESIFDYSRIAPCPYTHILDPGQFAYPLTITCEDMDNTKQP